MSHSYSDIAIQYFDVKILEYTLAIERYVHMFFVVLIFLKIKLKTFLKALFRVSDRICDSDEKFEKHST